MQILKSDSYSIKSESNVVEVRQVIRKAVTQLKFSLTDQTKMVTAASEIARNTLIYGNGGDVTIEEVESMGRIGLKLTFVDQGPGIPDLEKAMTDGFTSGNGLGLGLSGSKRLVHEFHLESTVGVGTRISLLRWK